MSLRYDNAELDIAARTVFGEARGEVYAGKVAVAWVIRNRVEAKRFGEGVIGVCMKRLQFSCWNPTDPNAKRLRDAAPIVGRPFTECLQACIEAFSGDTDPTGGATHYCTIQLHPRWADGKLPSAVIGGHKFFSNVA